MSDTRDDYWELQCYELRAECAKLREDLTRAQGDKLVDNMKAVEEIERLRAVLEIVRPYVEAWGKLHNSGLTTGMTEQTLQQIDAALEETK